MSAVDGRAGNDNLRVKVLSVNVGRAEKRRIGERLVATAIGKRPVAGPVAVGPLGLAGDEQADPSVHGGPSKAVYAYSSAHYPFWQTVRAQARVALWDEPLPHGLLGENLTIEGLDERALWIGDRLVLPGCVLAVSEPRFPCFKFGAAMGFPQAVKLMSQSGFCGAYLAVIEPGTVQAGDAIRLEPGPREVGIRELFRAKLGL
jgi:MOSC domain-containing protein YiiM